MERHHSKLAGLGYLFSGQGKAERMEPTAAMASVAMARPLLHPQATPPARRHSRRWPPPDSHHLPELTAHREVWVKEAEAAHLTRSEEAALEARAVVEARAEAPVKEAARASRSPSSTRA